MKLLSVAGVSVGTTTNGGPLGVVTEGWGLAAGVALGVMVGGVNFGDGVTFGSGVTLVGSGVLMVAGGLAGGVTVIAGATIPATLSAHNMAITPELMLVGFMVLAPAPLANDDYR
ncbi:hypothetical protein [Chamaesiphon sp. OTE_75_metabat_556]|uniref:hypothetical protein n=1 Tax=Chamaesiphon sp. OTE_75_metabat_556 TaxID=2964692 RepID=UPI00286CAFE3|nr:hypothetical protein [Chamaesiphon sp. OTE_75_metabat_556]